jgi:hypothetical protein
MKMCPLEVEISRAMLIITFLKNNNTEQYDQYVSGSTRPYLCQFQNQILRGFYYLAQDCSLHLLQIPIRDAYCQFC